VSLDSLENLILGNAARLRVYHFETEIINQRVSGSEATNPHQQQPL
jgi:hypothetical protein